MYFYSSAGNLLSYEGGRTAADIIGRTSAESSRSVQGLKKGVSGKSYPRLCNARRPRLKPGTFRSQAVRLYRLHQARPSAAYIIDFIKKNKGSTPGEAAVVDGVVESVAVEDEGTASSESVKDEV